MLKLTVSLMALIMLSPLNMAYSQNADGSGPGNVFVTPEETDDGSNDDFEIPTDLDFFLSTGYQYPDFAVYYNLRHDAAREVVVPDYTKRTGRIPPDKVLLEIAPIYVTGGDYNDMLVLSHLPGDCVASGCLGQIYKTKDGENWIKAVEFTSLAFAYKQATDTSASEIVAIGNHEFPNQFFKWNGMTFVKQ